MSHVAAVDGSARLLLESEVPLVAELNKARYHPVVPPSVTDAKLVQL